MTEPLRVFGGRRGLIAVLVLSSVSGCEACERFEDFFGFGDVTAIEDWEYAPPPPITAAVARLLIVPGETHAPPGAQFLLDVRAWDTFGRRVAPPAGLSWTASPGVAVSGDAPALASLTSSAGGTIQVTVSYGSVTSPTASIQVAKDAGDRADVPYVGGAVPDALLLDACEGVDAVTDARYMIVDKADLGRNLVPGCGVPEAALFATTQGARLDVTSASLPNVVPPWQTTPNDVLTRTAILPQRAVSVWMSVLTGAPALEEPIARTEIENVASEIFTNDRVGIRFQVIAASLAGGSVKANPSVCSDAGKLSTLGADVSLARLYVVVLDDLSGYRGYTCPPLAGSPGRVILADVDRSPTTLAHELGHVLALDAPLGSYGHTGSSFHQMVGFEYPNLMWVGEDFEEVLPRTGVTLGQAYRMNFDARSWALNGPPKDCQCEHHSSGTCPRLDLDVVDLPPAPGDVLLCTPAP